VIVYKVDRLSRSLLDFARMMETFQKHDISFVVSLGVIQIASGQLRNGEVIQGLGQAAPGSQPLADDAIVLGPTRFGVPLAQVGCHDRPG